MSKLTRGEYTSAGPDDLKLTEELSDKSAYEKVRGYHLNPVNIFKQVSETDSDDLGNSPREVAETMSP